jgi:hypothetical protein
MKRWVLVAFFAAFSLGLFQESADAACFLDADEAACCVCLCHTPAATPMASSGLKAPSARETYPRQELHIILSLFVDAIFHPPKHLA